MSNWRSKSKWDEKMKCIESKITRLKESNIYNIKDGYFNLDDFYDNLSSKFEKQKS